MTWINLARAVITVVWFALFVGIWINAWRRARQDEFLSASRLPLESAETAGRPHKEFL